MRGGAVELMEDLSDADTHGMNCLWSSSLALAKLLEAGLPSERPNGLDGAHVLELGAGLGLAAMVAAARGATVLATERAGPSLDVLASNLKNNQASTSGRAQAHALDWAQRGAVQQLLRQLNVVPHMAMASDVCYSNEGLDLLVPTLLELCAVAPRVIIWFAQDKECVPGGARIADRFFESLLPAAGFRVHCHPSEQLLSREWSDPNVAFYRVTLNSQQNSLGEVPPSSAASPMVIL